MDFSELVEHCQAEALANKISPTNESLWRHFCRSYSKKFHTPLHIVEELEPLAVLQAVYEDGMSDFDVEDNIEDVMDQLYSLQDPNYEKQKNNDLKDFMKRALIEEEQRLASGKPIHKAMKQEVSLPKGTSENTKSDDKKLPQSGGINLAYLEKEDSEDEYGDF